jgi:hypothetical protein
LTLSLVGRFLQRTHGGDVRKRDRVKFHTADARAQNRGHAFRAMAAYERWLAAGEPDNQRQLALLRLLGLFDRPAPSRLLAVLRVEPAISGLTDFLVNLEDVEWNCLASELADCRLLVREGDGIDAHPLIREYFARRLQGMDVGTEMPASNLDDGAAWREAHGRLFDSLSEDTEYRPDSLAGLQPLYQAIYHGCQAGRQQEACVDLYRDRIARGEEAFAVKTLGAFGADLGAVACFFEATWSRVSRFVSAADQAWLFGAAAFRLRALGRLREAVEPMRVGLEMRVNQYDWKNAADIAGSLSELELRLGRVKTAVVDSEKSVDFADRSGDTFLRMYNRAKFAVAQHQAGAESAALVVFREAELLQAKERPEFPLLFAVGGSSREDLDEAQEIAESSEMKLYLADVAIYRARFFRDRSALVVARRLVEE